jgi:hypothetical protein
MPDIDLPAAATAHAAERQQAIEGLYISNFSYIQELCESDPTLNFGTAEKIAEALAKYINQYGGPLSDESFRAWLQVIVLPALSFAAIYRDCREHVQAAIRTVFATCLDLGITQDAHNDAEQGTWFWAWEHLDSLRAPKQKAKPKTRLYSVAKFQALSIRKTLLRSKERFANISLGRIGSEANVYECTGVVIEPLEREQDDAYERRETVGKAA